jgi:hypothetical protein
MLLGSPFDMRKPGCRAADEAFGTSPNKAFDSKVRLFIEDHTHDPQLWMTPRGSLAEQLPDGRGYVLGEYWWGEPYPKRDPYLAEQTEEMQMQVQMTLRMLLKCFRARQQLSPNHHGKLPQDDGSSVGRNVSDPCRG